MYLQIHAHVGQQQKLKKVRPLFGAIAITNAHTQSSVSITNQETVTYLQQEGRYSFPACRDGNESWRINLNYKRLIKINNYATRFLEFDYCMMDNHHHIYNVNTDRNKFT